MGWMRRTAVLGLAALAASACGLGAGRIECETCQIDISDMESSGAVVTVDLTASSRTLGEVTVEIKPPGANWREVGKITVDGEEPVTLTVPASELPSFVQMARVKLPDEGAEPIELQIAQ